MGLERVRIVLVRPRNPGNVGATARAMKNMGLGRLVLVAPRRFDALRAGEMAVHAADVLQRLETAPNLGAAIADCGLVVGTSSRPTLLRRGALGPRALAAEVVALSAVNDVALVFGPEDHGLPAADLALCHRVVSIPTSSAYASLNLAQAVLLFAYEVFLAAAEGAPATGRALASSERQELMYGKLEEALRTIGFLHRDNGEHMMRTFRGMLGRSALDEREVRVLLGLARQIRWSAQHGRADAHVADGGAGHDPEPGACTPRGSDRWAL